MALIGDCIFCKIVAGLAPAHRVHEDDLTVSFLDIKPASRGHVLVVPKRHFADVFGADEESLLRVMANSRRIAHALKGALAPDGLAVHQLNGAAAGQSVFHYHVHLIPRRIGDSSGLHGRALMPASELAETAARIAAALRKSD